MTIEELEKVIETAMAEVAGLSLSEHKNLLGDRWQYIHVIARAIKDTETEKIRWLGYSLGG